MRISDNGTLHLESAKIAGFYAFLGLIWIVFSDRFLADLLGHDIVKLTLFQSWKGTFFVLTTAVVLYLLLRGFERHRNRMNNAYESVIRGPYQFYWFSDASGAPERVSEGFRELTGTDNRFLSESAWQAFIHPADRVPALLRRKRALEDGSEYEVTVRIRNRHGEYRHLHVRETPLLDLDGAVSGWIGICNDVTGSKLLEQMLEEEQRYLRLAQEAAGVSIWHWDFSNDNVEFSVTLDEQLGYRSGERAGGVEGFLDAVHPEDRKDLRRQIDSIFADEDYLEKNIFRLRHHDGSYRWIMTKLTPIRDEQSALLGIAGANVDITDQKKSEQAYRHLAEHDLATGLYNHNYFHKMLPDLLALAKKNAERMALVFVDIDHFKSINDEQGTLASDRLLKAFSERLQDFFHEEALICRQSGDRFVVLVNGDLSEDDIIIRVNMLLEFIEHPFYVEGQSLYLTASAGISLFPDHASDAIELFKQGDTALYQAKRKGRNTFVMFESKMQQEAIDWASYHAALLYALKHDEINAHYQPQLRTKDGRIVAFEALARWHSHTLGMVPPDRFIEVAERSGLIERLSQLVTKKALTALASWKEAGYTDIAVALNVSVRQLSPDYSKWLAGMVQFCGLEACDVEIEVTESAVMRDVELGRRTLSDLKKLGFRIAIDDFGTGYSSLSYLDALDPDVLKVDKSFVAGLPENAGSMQIVKGVIKLAHSLGIQVVTEGVESDEQLETVKTLGADFVQGFGIAKPMPETEVLSWLESNVVG